MSLSLYIYIYIYIHDREGWGRHPEVKPKLSGRSINDPGMCNEINGMRMYIIYCSEATYTLIYILS